MTKRKAYKLVKKRKDGSLGPLFINARLRLKLDEWMEAETHHRKKGFAYRPGWHCTKEKSAPHLSEKNRVWVEVEIEDYEEFRRPDSQGGIWFLAKRMKIIKVLE